MERYCLQVIGMSCKSCENIVRNEVTRLRGVSSVDPDAQANEVVIEGAPETESRVRQAITEIGYDVAE